MENFKGESSCIELREMCKWRTLLLTGRKFASRYKESKMFRLENLTT